MHICFLSKTTIKHCVGGVPDLLDSLVKGLIKMGHEVSIITTPYNQIEREFSDGIKYYFVGDKPQKLSLKYFEGCVRLIKQLRPDIIHSIDSAGYGVLKAGLNIPVITTFHGTSYDEWRTRLNTFNLLEPLITAREMAIAAIYGYRYLAYERYVGTNSTALIATSNEQVDVYNKIYNPQKVFTVFNGIDTDLFKPIKSSEPDKETLLVVARLEVEKGVQNVIRAMDYIKSVRPNLKLTIIGEGFYKPKLIKLTNRLGLQDKVFFKGYVDFKTLPQLYNQCSVFVNHTNRQNGYDLTNVQAMACEKPIISTDIGSYPTLITDHKDGYLIRLKDYEHLGVMINSALIHKEIGVKAREKILSHFTVKQMVQSHINLYNEVLK